MQTDVSETVQEPVAVPENGVPVDPAIAGTMIVFEGVTKVYEPNVVALNDVSFVIEKGEFVFVVGASGSGKSTMIRLLLKELEPSSGRILVGGRDLTRLKHSKVPLLRRNVGCVFQDFKLLRDRSAAVRFGSSLKSWKTQPTLRRRSGTRDRLSRPRSRPPTMIMPSVGSSSFSSRRTSVDLPEPDAPTMNTNSPFSIRNVTSESATTAGS